MDKNEDQGFNTETVNRQRDAEKKSDSCSFVSMRGFNILCVFFVTLSENCGSSIEVETRDYLFVGAVVCSRVWRRNRFSRPLQQRSRYQCGADLASGGFVEAAASARVQRYHVCLGTGCAEPDRHGLGRSRPAVGGGELH